MQKDSTPYTFVMAFDESYKAMGRALVNAVNYYHDYPEILIYTTSFDVISKEFNARNIIVINFSATKYNYSDWHPLIWAKIEAFNLPRKSIIVFLDVDIILYGSLQSYIEKFSESGYAIAACADDDDFTSQFSAFPAELGELASFRPLNAGVMLFVPDALVYQQLVDIADKYHRIARFPEQTVLNVYAALHNGWFNLGNELVIYPYNKRVVTQAPPYSILHFYAPRPSFFGNMGYRENELDFEDQVTLFESLYGADYPLERISADFKIRYNNQLHFAENELAVHFKIPADQICILQALPGWTNTIRWKLQAGDAVYLLKEKIDHFSVDHFRFKVSFAAALSSAFPGIMPAQLKFNDDYFFQSADNKLFEVQQWVEGKKFMPACSKDYHQIGRLLAAFDNAALQLSEKFSAQPDFYRPADTPERTQDVLQYLEAHVRSRLPASECYMNISHWLQSVSFPTGEGQQYIHGDCFGDNIIISKENKLMLVDLDEIHRGSRLTDLALAVCAYCGFNINAAEEYSVKDFDIENAEAIINAYNTVAPLSNKEKKHLPVFLKLNYLRLFVDCLQLDDPIESPPDLDEQFKLLHDNFSILDCCYERC